MKKGIVILGVLCALITNAQVGIGTTNPQAQLEVSGGNVRFSDYGSGTQTGTDQYLLGVNADGDVIEVDKKELDNRGLQFYVFEEYARRAELENKRGLPVPVNSGHLTGNLDNGTRTALRPGNSTYTLHFIGTLKVEKSGSFEFTATSDDGSAIYIDNVLVLDNWGTHSATGVTAQINLAAGEHRIEFWYSEFLGTETMLFEWGDNPDGYSGVIEGKQFFVK